MRKRVFLLPILLVGGCGDTCQNQAIKRLKSPDGEHVAVLFQRDCGATTGLSTQVSISEDGELASGRANAFSADDNHGAASVGPWGGPMAEIKWLGSDRLLVRYAAKSRVFKQEHEVSSITISYERGDPSSSTTIH